MCKLNLISGILLVWGGLFDWLSLDVQIRLSQIGSCVFDRTPRQLSQSVMNQQAVFEFSGTIIKILFVGWKKLICLSGLQLLTAHQKSHPVSPHELMSLLRSAAQLSSSINFGIFSEITSLKTKWEQICS